EPSAARKLLPLLLGRGEGRGEESLLSPAGFMGRSENNRWSAKCRREANSYPVEELPSRRDFLRQSASALMVGGLTLASGCSTLSRSGYGQQPLVGSQLYGWGQYYDRAHKRMDEHLDEVLSAIRDCGYDYAETTLNLDKLEHNSRFAERCQSKGLRPVSWYTGGQFHEQAKATETVRKILEAAKDCAASGYRVINCNPDPIGREKTDQELSVQVATLRELGAGLNRLGMRLGIHHHAPELRNRAREFHYNFQNGEPELVGFCYDVHWVFRGGLSPKDVLRQYGDRVVSWHLRQSRGGIWWEDLDTGDIDYGGIARFARRRHLAPFFTVELALEDGTKITRSVVENHRRSREFVRMVFGA
ncbi:MAG: sugar phosphate isomerase/epimerase, partial [Verrucomicrobiales bacterium]|nr:sugar phosphate isomerase/epimerase [Verrucomicrobiales bacterium]